LNKVFTTEDINEAKMDSKLHYNKSVSSKFISKFYFKKQN